jgi:hypothetical protein
MMQSQFRPLEGVLDRKWCHYSIGRCQFPNFVACWHFSHISSRFEVTNGFLRHKVSGARFWPLGQVLDQKWRHISIPCSRFSIRATSRLLVYLEPFQSYWRFSIWLETLTRGEKIGGFGCKWSPSVKVCNATTKRHFFASKCVTSAVVHVS